MNSLILWFAQGFGSGRIPFGPGTFGSFVGLAWFAVLLLTKSFLLFCIGIVLSIFFSVWICGRAEKILKLEDPGSVVMDEIIAVPLCFVSWLAILYFQRGSWPTPEFFFTTPNWPMTVAIFILFRVSDIAKPWPVNRSQSLPGGWGVTADDVLAAVYVNLVILLWWWLKPGWFVHPAVSAG